MQLGPECSVCVLLGSGGVGGVEVGGDRGQGVRALVHPGNVHLHTKVWLVWKNS